MERSPEHTHHASTRKQPSQGPKNERSSGLCFDLIAYGRSVLSALEELCAYQVLIPNMDSCSCDEPRQLGAIGSGMTPKVDQEWSTLCARCEWREQIDWRDRRPTGGFEASSRGGGRSERSRRGRGKGDEGGNCRSTLNCLKRRPFDVNEDLVFHLLPACGCRICRTKKYRPHILAFLLDTTTQSRPAEDYKTSTLSAGAAK